MMSFGTGFVLGFLFRNKQDKPLLREKNSVKSWWEFHTSNLYDDVKNECIKKYATERGYDLNIDERIIKAAVTYPHKSYGKVLNMMLERAKEMKEEAKKWKSWTKRKEARLLIKMIKKHQKVYRRYMK